MIYIISLDRFRDKQEGAHHTNAIDLFLGKNHIEYSLKNNPRMVRIVKRRARIFIMALL